MPMPLLAGVNRPRGRMGAMATRWDFVALWEGRQIGTNRGQSVSTGTTRGRDISSYTTAAATGVK